MALPVSTNECSSSRIARWEAIARKATDVQVRLAALYVKAGRIAAARELLMNAIGTLERKRWTATRAGARDLR